MKKNYPNLKNLKGMILPDITPEIYIDNILSNRGIFSDFRHFAQYCKKNAYAKISVVSVEKYIKENIVQLMSKNSADIQDAILEIVNNQGLIGVLNELHFICQKDVLNEDLKEKATSITLELTAIDEYYNEYSFKNENILENIEKQMNDFDQKLDETNKYFNEEIENIQKEIRFLKNTILVNQSYSSDEGLIQDMEEGRIELKKNKYAFEKMADTLKKKYPGYFAVFSKGKFITADKNMDIAIEKANKSVSEKALSPYIVHLKDNSDC